MPSYKPLNNYPLYQKTPLGRQNKKFFQQKIQIFDFLQRKVFKLPAHPPKIKLTIIKTTGYSRAGKRKGVKTVWPVLLYPVTPVRFPLGRQGKNVLPGDFVLISA